MEQRTKRELRARVNRGVAFLEVVLPEWWCHLWPHEGRCVPIYKLMLILAGPTAKAPAEAARALGLISKAEVKDLGFWTRSQTSQRATAEARRLGIIWARKAKAKYEAEMTPLRKRTRKKDCRKQSAIPT